MPAPFTIVTFEDADGDEFPVWVEGTPKRNVAISTADASLKELIYGGDLSPQHPIKVAAVEVCAVSGLVNPSA